MSISRTLFSDNLLVEPIVKQQRMQMCLNCPRLFSMTKNCKECGCFVNEKTEWRNEHCPLGKW